MNTEFKTIKEFIDYRKKCIFCNEPLTPVLSNFAIHDSTIPVINSRLIHDEFRFNLKYNSSEINLSSKCSININSNLLTIYDEYFCYETLVNVFFNLKPHIELTCNNKKCSSKYKLYSNFFSMPIMNVSSGETFIGNGKFVKIKPFISYYDTCNINKYTIQSDWIYKITYIIHKKNLESDPIEVPFINFTEFTLDRLTNRISTIVAFL